MTTIISLFPEKGVTFVLDALSLCASTPFPWYCCVSFLSSSCMNSLKLGGISMGWPSLLGGLEDWRSRLSGLSWKVVRVGLWSNRGLLWRCSLLFLRSDCLFDSAWASACADLASSCHILAKKVISASGKFDVLKDSSMVDWMVWMDSFSLAIVAWWCSSAMEHSWRAHFFCASSH